MRLLLALPGWLAAKEADPSPPMPDAGTARLANTVAQCFLIGLNVIHYAHVQWYTINRKPRKDR